MQNFSLRRTLMLVRRIITTDPQRWRNYALLIYLAYAIPSIYLLNSTRHLQPLYLNDMLANSASAANTISIILSMLAASLTFKCMNSKTKRLGFLTLPATHLEKFVSLLLVYVILFQIVNFLAFLLADLTQYLFFLVQGVNAGFMLPLFSPNFSGISIARDSMLFTETELGEHIWQITLILYLATICRIATFILGSAIFRRQAFVLTILFFFVTGMGLLTLVILPLDDVLMLNLDFIRKIDAGTICNAIILAELAWTTACCWLSYRMFAKASVITSKNIGF